MLVGVGDGVAVGSNVGVAVGDSVGVAVGSGVGVAVGSGVGVAVGSGVGVAVGSGVGVAVGSGVGVAVAVGSRVGVAVGSGVLAGTGLGGSLVHAASRMATSKPSTAYHTGWGTNMVKTPSPLDPILIKDCALSASPSTARPYRSASASSPPPPALPRRWFPVPGRAALRLSWKRPQVRGGA